MRLLAWTRCIRRFEPLHKSVLPPSTSPFTDSLTAVHWGLSPRLLCNHFNTQQTNWKMWKESMTEAWSQYLFHESIKLMVLHTLLLSTKTRPVWVQIWGRTYTHAWQTGLWCAWYLTVWKIFRKQRRGLCAVAECGQCCWWRRRWRRRAGRPLGRELQFEPFLEGREDLGRVWEKDRLH